MPSGGLGLEEGHRLGARERAPGTDLQGRILLTEPLASTAGDRLLVRSQGLSGDELWLVVQYEYTPGFEDLDALAAGGTGSLWVTDWLKLGATGNRNEGDESDSSL